MTTSVAETPELSIVGDLAKLREDFVQSLTTFARELNNDRKMDRQTFATVIGLAGAFGINDGDWKITDYSNESQRKGTIRHWKDPSGEHFPDHVLGQSIIVEFIWCRLAGKEPEEYRSLKH